MEQASEEGTPYYVVTASKGKKKVQLKVRDKVVTLALAKIAYANVFTLFVDVHAEVPTKLDLEVGRTPSGK